MSTRAWLYIYFILGAGLAAGLWTLLVPVDLTAQWLTFTMLVVLATMAQALKAEGPGHQLYYTSKVFQFAAVLLLHPRLFVLLILISHGVEWLKERITDGPHLRLWYLQPFNIAVHVLSGLAAYLWLFGPSGRMGVVIDSSSTTVAMVLIAALIYLWVNHLAIGVALMVARGLSLADSGIMAVETQVTDYVLLLMGYVVALLWIMNPWLLIPAIAPLYLTYRALTIPKLEREARFDGKTGLLNAKYFMELATAEYMRARQAEERFALLMVDLDFLRKINNTYGHLAGDDVLSGISRAIRETIRGSDFAGRFGGEEFVLLLSNVSPEQALAIAERLRAVVAATRFESATTESTIHATLSVGLATFPEDGGTLEELLHAADVAVYQAKVQGRNRVVCTRDVPHSFRLESAGLGVSEIDDGEAYVLPVADPVPPESRPAPVAPEPAPSDEAGPWSRRMRLFFGIVVTLAYGLALLGLMLDRETDIPLVLLFAFFAFLAELYGVSLYDEASVSVSMALNFAIALTGSVIGIAVVSAAITLGMQTAGRRRVPLYKLIFNGAVHFLAGLSALLLLSPLAYDLTVAAIPLLFLPALAAVALYFMIETGLVAGAIALSTQQRVAMIWRSQFQWLGTHYLTQGFLGMLLLVATTEHGALGALVFTSPLLVLRLAQQQYISRTENSVSELQRMNRELNHANQEIRSATGSIQQLNDELFQTLAQIIDARDPFVSGHADKVADYATAIGIELGLTGLRLSRLRQAALLHDIGKIGVAEQILHKPGRLTEEEYNHVKRHADLGGDLLQTSRSLSELAPFVRHHHERWDGGGYPAGLAAEAIPLEARIIAVCDAVETMASDRPYKRALSLDEIIVELRRCAGSQFDPTVTHIFLEIIERSGVEFVVNSAHEVVRQQRARKQERAVTEWAPA